MPIPLRILGYLHTLAYTWVPTNNRFPYYHRETMTVTESKVIKLFAYDAFSHKRNASK